LGDRKDIRPIKTCATLIPKGSVPEEFEEENGGELAK